MRVAMICVALLGCEAASPELGLDAVLRVEGGQYRPGPFPSDEGGPAALAVQTAHPTVIAGGFDERVQGVLDPSATAAILGVDGFDGAWIVPAGVAGPGMPGFPTVRAVIGFSADGQLGPLDLMLAAGDRDGVVGAAVTAPIIVAAQPPPEGLLVVRLEWGGTADLDLHVVDPLGGEAWSDKPNTWTPPPPGEPVPPGAHLVGGILDHDGNSNCRRDGRPNEHVVWRMPPPPGEYIVRVDTRSMCRDASTPWYVAVYRGGELVTAVRGTSTPDDVLQPHGAGAGVTAVRFTVP